MINNPILKHCVITALLLAAALGCTRSDAVSIARVATSGNIGAAAEGLARSKAIGYATNPYALAGDLKRLSSLIEKFIVGVSGVWGKKDTRLPQPKVYVKYGPGYLSRASVDFDKGLVTVETVDQKNPREQLRQAIIVTLLAPDDPRAINLYEAGNVTLGDTPFLLGEVLDKDNQPIRWEWRAEKFATTMVESSTRTRKLANGKIAYYVNIPMVRDHLMIRAAKYRELVDHAAKKYDLSKNLIYAIMKVESDFNPFAISHAGAVGLMQVVPSTAGSDVHLYLKGKKGKPTVDQLLQPPTNITYGSAYLHMLETRLMPGINNRASQEYCVIAAYNGGPGAVLRTFHKDRTTAIRKINAAGPESVKKNLMAKLPSAETKRYLEKVLKARKQFVNI